jgi:arsenite methyltransferase
MIISDLITTKEISKDDEINTNNWCSCIDGALTKKIIYKALKMQDSKTLRY